MLLLSSDENKERTQALKSDRQPPLRSCVTSHRLRKLSDSSFPSSAKWWRGYLLSRDGMKIKWNNVSKYVQPPGQCPACDRLPGMAITIARLKLLPWLCISKNWVMRECFPFWRWVRQSRCFSSCQPNLPHLMVWIMAKIEQNTRIFFFNYVRPASCWVLW